METEPKPTGAKGSPFIHINKLGKQCKRTLKYLKYNVSYEKYKSF